MILIHIYYKQQQCHWSGSAMEILGISKLTVIGSDNGLLLDWRQAIIWTNAGTLWIWPLGINFKGILIEIHISSFKKIHLKMLSVKCDPFCHGLNVLTSSICVDETPLKRPPLRVVLNTRLSLTWVSVITSSQLIYIKPLDIFFLNCKWVSSDRTQWILKGPSLASNTKDDLNYPVKIYLFLTNFCIFLLASFLFKKNSNSFFFPPKTLKKTNVFTADQSCVEPLASSDPHKLPYLCQTCHPILLLLIITPHPTQLYSHELISSFCT